MYIEGAWRQSVGVLSKNMTISSALESQGCRPMLLETGGMFGETATEPTKGKIQVHPYYSPEGE